jgi:hypothetical protein
MSVAVAEQLRGDRITVGLVMDQDTAEVVASLRVELLEKFAEVAIRRFVRIRSPRSSLARASPSQNWSSLNIHD